MTERNRQGKKQRWKDRDGLTAVRKEADDCSAESGARPEVTGNDAVQADEQPAGSASPQREEELGLDELTTRPSSAPLDASVAHVQHQPRVLPVHHAVNDL